jgi:hypothetical protein
VRYLLVPRREAFQKTVDWHLRRSRNSNFLEREHVLPFCRQSVLYLDQLIELKGDIEALFSSEQRQTTVRKNDSAAKPDTLVVYAEAPGPRIFLIGNV